MADVTHQHDWKSTGGYRPHAQIGRVRPVWYVSCECGWVGFTRGSSAVVYTWDPNKKNWCDDGAAT